MPRLLGPGLWPAGSSDDTAFRNRCRPRCANWTWHL